MNLPTHQRLQQHTNELTELKRRHYLPETDIRENDVSHSYSVALLAWHLNHELGLQLNDEKILKYAIVHDFVEVYAGDVNAFAPAAARRQKEIDEALAFERIRAEYGEDSDFIATIKDYEAKRDDESRFVWSCDKIQALIQGQLDNWRCYYELKITDEQFAAKLAEIRAGSPQYLLEFYDEFAASCLASYHYTEPQDTLF